MALLKMHIPLLNANHYTSNNNYYKLYSTFQKHRKPKKCSSSLCTYKYIQTSLGNPYRNTFQLVAMGTVFPEKYIKYTDLYKYTVLR